MACLYSLSKQSQYRCQYIFRQKEESLWNWVHFIFHSVTETYLSTLLNGIHPSVLTLNNAYLPFLHCHMLVSFSTDMVAFLFIYTYCLYLEDKHLISRNLNKSGFQIQIYARDTVHGTGSSFYLPGENRFQARFHDRIRANYGMAQNRNRHPGLYHKAILPGLKLLAFFSSSEILYE